MSMLGWAKNLAAQPDATRAEFLLLASLKDPEHKVVQGVKSSYSFEPDRSITEFDYDSPLVLAHQVMFATGFGKEKMTDAKMAAYLTKVAYHFDRQDHVACILIALFCLDAPLPADRLEYVEYKYRKDGPPKSWGWLEYHQYIATDVLFALLKRPIKFGFY